MAIPVDSTLYISPNTITNLTVWINGVQSSFDYGPTVSGDYLYCLWSGQSTSAILKAPGYQDYSVSLIDGAQYITMIHVPENLYAWDYEGTIIYTDSPTPSNGAYYYNNNGKRYEQYELVVGMYALFYCINSYNSQNDTINISGDPA